MVEIITYSLKNQQQSSDQYFRDISAFTDHVIEQAGTSQGRLLASFRQHIVDLGLEELRSQPEYILDLFLLGMLFRIYAADAGQLAKPSQRLLAWLFRARQQNQWLKPIIDFLRGGLAGLLLPTDGSPPSQPSYETFTQLLEWMRAAGDFSEEIKRLSLWDSYLASLTPDAQIATIQQAVSLAQWFTTESEKKLGQYTPNVDRFLQEKHPAYRWREDRFFCGRRREEYHLYMVGTEILNRTFQDQFRSTERKIVLLPPCMKARQDDTCQAEPSPLGDKCGHCTPGCRIHQTTLLGEKHGFSVAIIPHELSVFSSGRLAAPSQTSIGLVGVSCPITNVTGGWETKDLRVPAQGLLLDYCGCYWHWHKDGIPTDINFNQLLKLVRPDEPSR